jgi:Peptidase family M28
MSRRTRPFEGRAYRQFRHSGATGTIVPPPRDNPPPVDAAGRIELIRELCSFEGRGPGTDAERRAANMLAGRLRRIGRRAEIEPTLIHPQYATVHLIHATLAIAGSVLATVQPAAGFALVLAVAASTYLDLNARLYLVRSLIFRRASQNVVSPGSRPEAPIRLILSAHYDAARTGWVFSRRMRRGERAGARPTPGPFRIFFWAGLAPLLLILGLGMAGIDATWLAALQAVPTILLIAAAFLLIDIALSATVPGAYDNASGVAAVLSAAEELGAEPPANLDLWVVLPGSEESMCEGMRAFVKAHRKERDPGRTYVINVDSVSHGALNYEVSEGAVVSLPLDGELVELCEALAATAGADGDDLAAEPLRYSLLDDALPPRNAGMHAITLRATDGGAPAPWYHTTDDTPERVDERALSRATEFVVALARLLDRDAGRRSPAESLPEPAAQR